MRKRTVRILNSIVLVLAIALGVCGHHHNGADVECALCTTFVTQRQGDEETKLKVRSPGDGKPLSKPLRSSRIESQLAPSSSRKTLSKGVQLETVAIAGSSAPILDWKLARLSNPRAPPTLIA